MKLLFRLFIISVFIAVTYPVFVQAQIPAARYEFYDNDYPGPDVYKERRTKLLSQMDTNSVAVFRAAELKMRGGDVEYRYRQDNNFYYLTGCTEPSGYLLLIPSGITIDGKVTNEILFVQPARRTSSGYTMGVEGAKEYLGFKVALTNDKFDEYLPKVLQGKKVLYYSSFSQGFVYEPVSGKRYFVERDAKKELTQRYPGLQVKSLGSILASMREIKSPEELALIQKAIDITCAAQREAMKSAEPGMHEYELQAIIEYVFTRNGAEYQGFPSIIGSGPNSCILHYSANRRKMQDGDLVVMDIGAEYHGYCADVTRTIPVNGKFSPAQREIYELVLKAQAEALKEVKPGSTFQALNNKAAEVIGDGLMKLGIIKDKKEVSKFFIHGVSHYLGLDVHDVGDGKALQPGEVITMEPGIYIPAAAEGVDQRYWNIGVRIEDDVFVTKDGYKVLSNAPRTVDEIEKLMKQKGIGNMPVGK